MNKLNKIRAAAAALLVSFAVAVPLATAIQTGSFEEPSAAAATARPTAKAAPKTTVTASYEEPEEIVLPETVIVADHGKAHRAPCRAQDEGTRELVQGRGTVRTWTFCH